MLVIYNHRRYEMHMYPWNLYIGFLFVYFFKLYILYSVVLTTNNNRIHKSCRKSIQVVDGLLSHNLLFILLPCFLVSIFVSRIIPLTEFLFVLEDKQYCNCSLNCVFTHDYSVLLFSDSDFLKTFTDFI